MSLDVQGVLVIGEIIYQKETTKFVKKYNEDTGIPYNVKVTEKNWFFSDGSEIDFKHYLTEVDEGVLYNYDEDIGVIGFALDGRTCLRANHNEHAIEINQVQLEELKTKYYQKYKKVPKLINFLKYG